MLAPQEGGQSILPHSTPLHSISTPLDPAEQILMGRYGDTGSEDKGTTASVQKSGSRTPKRECTEGGDDQESRIVG